MKRRAQAGFTYLALMLAVLVMGVMLAALGEAWHAAAQRDKEAQLLFAGNQMRNALMQFYVHSPAQALRHPASLEALLRDERTAAVRRYLRKIEVDPMTGKPEWGLVRGAHGEIYGVHSLSETRPLKQGGFARADRAFAGAGKYSEWVFMFSPGQFTLPQAGAAR
jgi:type II secretory pathway pseudopilin PulG